MRLPFPRRGPPGASAISGIFLPGAPRPPIVLPPSVEAFVCSLVIWGAAAAVARISPVRAPPVSDLVWHPYALGAPPIRWSPHVVVGGSAGISCEGKKKKKNQSSKHLLCTNLVGVSLHESPFPLGPCCAIPDIIGCGLCPTYKTRATIGERHQYACALYEPSWNTWHLHVKLLCAKHFHSINIIHSPG